MNKQNMNNQEPNNVLKPWYADWKYPCNWWFNIKEFFRRYKWAYQRAKKGYSDKDLWNFDYFLLNAIHDGLIDLANKGNGFPGTKEFPTPEAWEQHLKEIASLLFKVDENNHYYPTPENEKWIDWWLDKHKNSKEDFWVEIEKRGEEKNPYTEAMLRESKQVEELRQRDFEEAWEKLGKIFFQLWD